MATVIASQAIISGVYSLTQQAVQLGFLPQLQVIHTDSDERGQVYVPLANWLLAAGTLGAVWPSAVPVRWPVPMVSRSRR